MAKVQVQGGRQMVNSCGMTITPSRNLLRMLAHTLSLSLVVLQEDQYIALAEMILF
jgi:hypothetical protein